MVSMRIFWKGGRMGERGVSGMSQEVRMQERSNVTHKEQPGRAMGRPKAQRPPKPADELDEALELGSEPSSL